MKNELIKILICPNCGGNTLEFKEIVDNHSGDTINEFLICNICNVRYSIVDGIPRLIK